MKTEELTEAMRNCLHENCHYKGTNGVVKITTCVDCGMVWKESKKGNNDPQTCQHLNTNRHSSTKGMIRVKCVDCGEVIDEIARELEAKMQPKKEAVTDAEASFARKVRDHRDMTKNDIIKAMQLLKAELDATECDPEDKFKFSDVVKRFEECADRAIDIPILRQGYGSSADPPGLNLNISPCYIPDADPLRAKLPLIDPLAH